MEMERGRARAHGCEQASRDGWHRKMREKGSQSQCQVESGAGGELPCGKGE